MICPHCLDGYGVRKGKLNFILNWLISLNYLLCEMKGLDKSLLSVLKIQ